MKVDTANLRQDLENRLRYFYELLDSDLFEESLETRIKALDKMKTLILGIKALSNLKNVAINQGKTNIQIKVSPKVSIILDYDTYVGGHNITFKGI